MGKTGNTVRDGAENGPYETAEIFAAKFVRVHSEADIDRQIKNCKVSLFFTIGLALFVLLSSTSLLIRVAVCVVGSGVLYGLLTLFSNRYGDFINRTRLVSTVDKLQNEANDEIAEDEVCEYINIQAFSTMTKNYWLEMRRIYYKIKTLQYLKAMRYAFVVTTIAIIVVVSIA